MKALSYYVILSFTLINSSLSYAEIYKWVDGKGRVHFSDREINNVHQETVRPQVQASKWSRYDIKIEAEGVSLSQAEIEGILGDVNHVYEFHGRILHFDFYKTVPVKILLLKDKATYYRYLKKKTGKKPPSSYGIYYPKDNQIIVYLREDRGGTFRTIRHEVSHAIVDTITPYAPAWLNEGLAEQMETLTKTSGQLLITQHKVNNKSVVYQARKNQLIRVGDFLRLPSPKWRHKSVNRGSSLQAYAGEFVHFLLSTSPDRNFIVRLMHKFERGDRTISYHLVDQNYIGGIRSMEIKWNRWLSSKSKREITL